MKNQIIEFKNISKKFRRNMTDFRSISSYLLNIPSNNDFFSLSEITFKIKKGESVGIIGKNGAGKSTLLKIIAGITKPSNGHFYVGGKLGALIEVGAGFHQELTGKENIYLYGSILGMSRKEISEKYNDIVNFADLNDFLDTPAKFYSTGMYLRLGFSVAIHTNPDILLIDEVFAVGDELFQRKCLKKIEDFRKQGKTIIIVSHNMDIIAQYTDRCIWLDRGVIKNDGRPQESIAKYLVDVVGDKKTDKLSSEINYKDRIYVGSDIVRLLSVSLHKEDFVLDTNFDITKSIGISMEYEVLKGGEEFTHGCNLYDESGTHILSSHDIVSSYSKVPKKIGKYKATMWIPPNLLNEGKVYVGVAILNQVPFKIHFHEEKVLSFNVFDPFDGKSARGQYLSRIPGVVRPLLRWDSEVCNEV